MMGGACNIYVCSNLIDSIGNDKISEHKKYDIEFQIGCNERLAWTGLASLVTSPASQHNASLQTPGSLYSLIPI